MRKISCFFFVVLVSTTFVNSHTTQRPGNDDSNPFMDMASAFLTETLANQGGGSGGGLGGIASIIGSFMQPEGKSSDNGAGAIISGIGSLLANVNGGNNGGGGGGGFDPSLIGNIIEIFASSQGNDRQKRSAGHQQESPGWETLLTMATTFLGNQNSQNSNHGRSQKHHGGSGSGGSGGEGLMSLLPMVMQAINSFSGPEGQRTQDKHKDHAWVLPPFLEQIHVMWDHFSNSELAEALWTKSGINIIFKGFTGRDGKLDYDKLFQSLENQSFRRRWIKAATLYLADWANYIADPEVYQRYFTTAHVMVNGFLKTQGFPKTTFFDPTRPSETLSNLVDHVAKRQLNVKISSITYVKPAVNYVKELLKLGQARGLLQKFNSTELSDKLTDTVNLEVIEPVLKVHRAYRFAVESPQCDKFVLCEVNSHDPNEKLGLAGFKAGITKFGSMAASWFISSETGTPFWTLFATISDPYNCQKRYPVDCSGFHEGEARVTTEYIHNEL